MWSKGQLIERLTSNPEDCPDTFGGRDLTELHFPEFFSSTGIFSSFPYLIRDIVSIGWVSLTGDRMENIICKQRTTSTGTTTTTTTKSDVSQFFVFSLRQHQVRVVFR